MESRFFNILTEGIKDVAAEGMTTGNGAELSSIVNLPGVTERLATIETLIYAGATEAVGAALLDLERHIKLLALESYNEISIKATESNEATAQLSKYSIATATSYALRLIEPIHSDTAESVREALEGYLYLLANNAELDVKEIMNNITDSLSVVLESVIDADLEEIEYEISEVVGMESAISLATEDIKEEIPETNLVASMYEICESLYDYACENLIRLEGDNVTLFDAAMEVMLGRRQYEENNKVEDLKKRITAVKSDAKKYVADLRKTQLDLDIERSRNNNLRISGRLERKVDKSRYDLDDDIKAINDKVKELGGLDYKNLEDRARIEAIIREIKSTYNDAVDSANKSRTKETKIIEGARNRQLKVATKGTLGERALNRLSGALKKGAEKAGGVIKGASSTAYRKVDRDLKDGKISEAEAKLRYKKIESMEKRGESISGKLNSAADDAGKRITKTTDKMKADREKVLADGGKYYRDKDLVEKDIKEANKKSKERLKSETKERAKKEKVQKPSEPKANKTEKKTKTEKASASKPEKLISPKDKSLYVENWDSLSPDQQASIKKLRSEYVKAYNKAKNTDVNDEAYQKVKSMYDMRLNILRKKIEEVSNPPISKQETPADKTEKKTRKKGKSNLRDRLSEADRKNYDRLLNTMTQFSKNVKDLEGKKDRTPEDEQKLTDLRAKLNTAQNNYNTFVRHHEATEAVAGNLFENIDVLQYAINSGYSVYDMSEMTSEAFESFIETVEDAIYEDCLIVATEAVKKKESRKERKAREAAEKEAAKKAEEEKIRKERSEARDKVIAYANTINEKLKKYRTDIGQKYATYSADIKNLTDRATDGNLRGIRNARERSMVKKSVAGQKYDFSKYEELLNNLKKAEKEINDFISSKEFYDGYDKTNNPSKDYKGAIKKINSIVGELLNTSKTDAEKAIDDVAGKAKETIDKVGKNIDKSSVVQHERDDKAAYTKHKKEDAEKKDRKENPDKYKLRETKTEFQKYLQDRNELEKKQAREKDASTSTISPAAVESMELPSCVTDIEDFGEDVTCMCIDLRETLIDPEIFFENPTELETIV